jgi:polyisoprenoid-binding protein YceI
MEQEQAKKAKEIFTQTPAPAGQDGTYTIDAERSSLKWKCGDDEGVVQSGSFKLTPTSQFTIEDGLVKAGQVDVDIRSLEIDYLPNWAAEKLTEELLSPLFFDGSRYPYALVTIHNSKRTDDQLNLATSLWIAGVQKFSTVPVEMEFLSETEALLRGQTTIDRREFGIKHRADNASSANEPSLSIIDDEVAITLVVYASVVTS